MTDIKEEIKIIRNCTEDISNLLDNLYVRVDNRIIYNPETDARIGVCLDIIDDTIGKIEDKTNIHILTEKEYQSIMNELIYLNTGDGG